MRLTARIPNREINGEKPRFVANLERRGFNAKMVKSGVVVELREQKKPTDREDGRYRIPDEALNSRLFIDIAERGGANSHTGCGTVICGRSGNSLLPYYILRGRNEPPCGKHACFSVSEAVVTVTGYFGSNKVTIRDLFIIRDGAVAIVRIKLLWEGNCFNIPERFVRFKAATRAAYDKGNCAYCTHVHFARRRDPVSR